MILRTQKVNNSIGLQLKGDKCMKCVICGNDKLDVLTEQLRYGNGTVYYCKECNHGMLEPRFTNALDYYDKEYRRKFKDQLTNLEEETPEEIYQTRCNYQYERINIIQDYFDKEKSFLEIGCSAGQFLNQVKNKFGKLKGIELSKKCAEYVQNKWGISVYSEEISEIDWKGEMFDYIGFFQVLEHIENPKLFLNNIHRRLSNEGKVFIEIPTLDDSLRKLWKIPAYEKFYYHEAHLNYFTEKSVRILLEECGYKVNHIYYIQDYNILNHLYWYFRNEPQPTCVMGLDKPIINFEPEDEHLEIAAKKLTNCWIIQIENI